MPSIRLNLAAHQHNGDVSIYTNYSRVGLTNRNYKHTRYVRMGIKPITSITPCPIYWNHNTYIYTHECLSLKYAQAPDLVIKIYITYISLGEDVGRGYTLFITKNDKIRCLSVHLYLMENVFAFIYSFISAISRHSYRIN